jgi:hypothetical protein
VATFNKLERDQGYREKSTSKPELGTSEWKKAYSVVGVLTLLCRST